MLEIDEKVERGILFMNLKGRLTTKTFNTLGNEINYLLYNQGILNFVIDFTNVSNYEENIVYSIQNKLVEIFLSCGKVVMCGMSELYRKQIGYTKDRLFYVNYGKEAFKYLRM